MSHAGAPLEPAGAPNRPPAARGAASPRRCGGGTGEARPLSPRKPWIQTKGREEDATRLVPLAAGRRDEGTDYELPTTSNEVGSRLLDLESGHDLHNAIDDEEDSGDDRENRDRRGGPQQQDRTRSDSGKATKDDPTS